MRQMIVLGFPPNAIAKIDSTAMHVMTAAGRLNGPPNTPTISPATSGPKLVITRPDPLQNDTAVARTWVGNSSGK